MNRFQEAVMGASGAARSAAEGQRGGLMSYFGGGVAESLGVEVHKGGYSSWGTQAFEKTGPGRFAPRKMVPGVTLGRGSWLGPAAGIGGTGFGMYMGYKEEGFAGVKESLVWDLAVNSALASNARTLMKSGVRMGMPSYFGRGIGGFAGAAVGSYMTGGGGGIVGTAGVMVGGAMGVFHAGKLGLAGAALGAGALVGYGGYSVLKAGYNHAQMKKGIHTSGNMQAFNSREAHTMRQRAVSAIHKSHLNARSALGQEASYMHFPGRNYHSRYRQ